MKATLTAIFLLGITLSCRKQSEQAPQLTGRIVRYETTFDQKASNPRIRWLVDVSPLTFNGLDGQPYQQVKVFGLPDTVAYRAGRTVRFRYQLVPYDQQTPWLTPYERFSVPAGPPGATPLPELIPTDVQ